MPVTILLEDWHVCWFAGVFWNLHRWTPSDGGCLLVWALSNRAATSDMECST